MWYRRRRVLLLVLPLLAAAASLLVLTVPSGNADPPALQFDHYGCQSADAAGLVQARVSLHDEFDGRGVNQGVTVGGLVRDCAPTEKTHRPKVYPIQQGVP